MGIISYAQNFEDVLLWRALGHIQQGCYIDIGAHDPIVDSVSKAFYEHGWRGIHLEPLPVYCNALRRDRPDETVLQAAVAAENGVLRFYEIPDTGISTGNEEIAKLHRERGFTVNEITVPGVTLAQVFQLVQGDVVHWLKIDVEGLEEQVLRSWGESSIRPWIVVVESTLPLTQDEAFSAWEGLLIVKKYRCVHFDGLNRYYLADAQSGLESAFRCGPNVFDDFQLYGTASNTFTKLVAQSIQNELGSQIDLLKQQALQYQNSEQNYATRLAEELTYSENLKQALQAEQIANLQNQNAAKSLALQFELRSHQLSQTLLNKLVIGEQTNAAELRRVHTESQSALTAQANEFSQRLCEFYTAAAEERLGLQQEFKLREQSLLDAIASAHQQISIGQSNADGLRTNLSLLQSELIKVQADFLLRERVLVDTAKSERQTLQTRIENLLIERVLIQKNYQHDLLQLHEQFKHIDQQHADDLRQKHVIYEAKEAELQTALVKAQSDFQLRERALREGADSERETLQTRIENLNINQLLVKQEHQAQLRQLDEINKQICCELELRIEEVQSLSLELHSIRQTLIWRLSHVFRRLNILSSNNPIDGCMPIDKNSSMGPTVLNMQLPDIAKGISAFPREDQISLSRVQSISQSSGFDMSKINDVYDLLQLTGSVFIEVAYRMILQRNVDPEGMRYYSGRLRMGFSKASILFQLATSKEAESHPCELLGLQEFLAEQKKSTHWLWGGWFRSQLIERQVCRIECQLDSMKDEIEKRQLEIIHRLVCVENRITNPNGLVQNLAPIEKHDASVSHVEIGAKTADLMEKNNIQNLLSITPRAKKIYELLRSAIATQRRD